MMIPLARDKKLVTLKNNTSTLVILQGYYCERSLNLIKMENTHNSIFGSKFSIFV